MRLINADAMVTVTVYDEEHEEHKRRDMTVEDMLDTYTDGCPPFIEERKTGKWNEYDNSHCECPFCHSVWGYFENMVEYFNYCPQCGADLKGEKNERN